MTSKVWLDIKKIVKKKTQKIAHLTPFSILRLETKRAKHLIPRFL